MPDPVCPICGDDRAQYLGTLGLSTWFRCRACGIEYTAGESAADSRALEPLELDAQLPAWA